MSISMYLDYPLSGVSSPPAMPFYVHSSSHTFSPPAGAAFVISFFVKNPDFFYSKTRKSYDRIFQNFTSQKCRITRKKCSHCQAHPRHLRRPFVVTPPPPRCIRPPPYLAPPLNVTNVHTRTFRKFHKSRGCKENNGQREKDSYTHTHTHMCTCPPLYLTWRGREAATDIQYKNKDKITSIQPRKPEQNLNGS